MSQKDKAIGIVKRLRDEGYESYLAGGCVRDLLLGKTPQDYDISTNAKPDCRKISSGVTLRSMEWSMTPLQVKLSISSTAERI